MKKHIALVLFFGLGFITILNAQGQLCSEVEPFCAGGAALTFANSHPGVPGASNAAEAGIDYSCGTGGGPNSPGNWPYPSWYFLKIDSDGDLNFSISQSQNADGSGTDFDVDFIAWGPFTTENVNCGADLTNANKIDCSWLPSTTEFMSIPNAMAGDIYIVMITNFSQQPGFITLQQTNTGDPTAGNTDCSIVNSIDLCEFEITSLDATTNGAIAYEWFRDGVLLSETGPILSNVVGPSAVYRANAYDSTNTIISVLEFNVNFFDQPTANPVNDQFICDDNNDGFWAFDLVALEGIILGAQSATDFDITFHSSQNDADMNMAPLASPYTNQVAYQNENIFVRIENVSNTTCFATTDFEIDVFNQPTANSVTFGLCDNTTDGDDANGFVEFNLASYNDLVLGSQDPTQYTLSYHNDQADADGNNNPLSNLYTNATVNSEQIIGRVENNNDSSCYATALITLVVNQLPVIASGVELRQCDNDADGFSDFNLTEANALISTNAANETFRFYTSSTDAISASNEITNPTAYTNTDSSANPDMLFVRVENADGCFRVAQLDLFVSVSQIPVGFNISYEACDDDVTDGDNTNGITSFNFSDATAQIETLYPPGQDISITYYENEADALAEINAIPDISNHRNDASPFSQNIYVRVDNNTDNSCSGLGHHLTLTTINPTPNLDPEDLILCDDITIGDLQEVFDLTVNEGYIFNGDPNVFATYYLTANDAEMAMNMIPNQASYTNSNPTETIYVRVENSNSGCYAIVEFDITVNPLPDDGVIIADFVICENNTDFVFPFDLESKNAEILNGQDPNAFTVTYYASQQDADDLTNPLTSPHNNVGNPQQIFVAITNNTTGCSISTLSFPIEVIEGADANSDGELLLYEICDNVGDNDGLGQFDLTTQDAEVFDGQDPMEFTLTYHDSMDDALNNVQPLPTLYENTSVDGNPPNPQVIYARVSNNLDPDTCFEIAELTLQVNLLPIFDIEESYILCRNINGSEIVDVPPVIDTQLSDADYAFEWSLNGTVLPTETGSSLIPTQGGIYSVVVMDTSTSLVTMCTSSDSTEVIESEPPVVTAEVTSDAFSGNHTIEATATGISTYEFSLDNGPWQEDGSFDDVSAGEHLVLARDVQGCGIGTNTVLIIDYPKYFTPNGDGNHESWNIIGIDTQPLAKIYIFDRYGKLLKQLDPRGPGWDGTFRGALMPTSDYWFRVEYNEPRTGSMKEFTAHFTLKR